MKDPTTVPANKPARSAAEAMLPVLPPLAALVEIGVLFGVLVLGDWLHPGLELADIRPHPFWIPVLLLSLQYGTVSGLVAAAVAISLTVGAGFPEQGTSETYFSYLLKIWIEPILWIGAAVLIGQFRMRQIAHKRELIAKVDELTSQRAAIADYARNLRRHCNALERHIAGSNVADPLRVLQALHQAAAGSSSDASDALPSALGSLVAAALPGARASLYAADQSGLRLVASTNGANVDHPQPVIPPTAPLYRAIVVEGGGISVLSREGEQRLAGSGLAAVPVYAHAQAGGTGVRTVVGMLKIDDMPAAALSAAIVPALAAMAHAFAPAMEIRASGRPAVVAIAAGPLPLTASQKIWRHLRWLRGREPEPAPGETLTAARRASSVTH